MVINKVDIRITVDIKVEIKAIKVEAAAAAATAVVVAADIKVVRTIPIATKEDIKVDKVALKVATIVIIQIIVDHRIINGKIIKAVALAEATEIIEVEDDPAIGINKMYL